ncbi:hypothetical protein [Aliikangiella sp. IMCC44359]|uniref:hypothetical protein n=1 Tax=Aliikangiella sp. IMCC44359 TaxID=3459125 RepID=UPI00403B06AC
MRNYRLIYSDFSSKLSDYHYLLRSLWIGLFGAVLIIFNAYESGSGFSQPLSFEGYIIYGTITLFFFFNYLSLRSSKMQKILACLSIVSLIYNCRLAFIAFRDYEHDFISALLLIVYSAVMLIILLPQKFLNKK